MDKVYGLIGLAKRAGRIACGEFLTTGAIKENSAQLVILASDASFNTKKKITDSCKFYNVCLVEYGTKDEHGRYTGGADRAVVTIKDKGFADAILKIVEQGKERNGE